MKNIFSVFFVFVLGFSVIFLLHKSASQKYFYDMNQQVPSIVKYSTLSDEIAMDMEKYGIYAGGVFGLLALIASIILYGVYAVFIRPKSHWPSLIISVIAYGALLLLGIELVFYENRYTAFGNGIIAYLGYSLLYSSIFIFAIIPIISIFSHQKHEVPLQ